MSGDGFDENAWYLFADLLALLWLGDAAFAFRTDVHSAAGFSKRWAVQIVPDLLRRGVPELRFEDRRG